MNDAETPKEAEMQKMTKLLPSMLQKRIAETKHTLTDKSAFQANLSLYEWRVLLDAANAQLRELRKMCGEDSASDLLGVVGGIEELIAEHKHSHTTGARLNAAMEWVEKNKADKRVSFRSDTGKDFMRGDILYNQTPIGYFRREPHKYAPNLWVFVMCNFNDEVMSSVAERDADEHHTTYPDDFVRKNIAMGLLLGHYFEKELADKA